MKIKHFFILFFCISFTIYSLSVNAQGQTDILKFPDLKIGDNGEYVKKLQKILNTNGFIVNPNQGEAGSISYETEKFGALTQKALALFQTAYGITPSKGYLGTKTKNKISKINTITKSTPISSIVIGCEVGDDLLSHVQNQFNSRIAGIESSTSTKSLWITRGDDKGGWQWNPNVWTNNGNKSIDWTGMSPWNSMWAPTAPYVKAGTLITPRHIVYATHYEIAVGTKIVFVDKNNTIIERTLIESKNSGGDIQIGLLDSDVPDSITHYPIVPESQILPRLSTVEGLPLVMFDQEDKALIADFNTLSFPQAFYYISKDNKRAEFYEMPIVGDSGSAGFIIVNNQPIVTITHTSPSSGPNYSAFYNQINQTLDQLGGGYRIKDYSIDCFKILPYTLTTTTSGTGSGIVSGIGISIDGQKTKKYYNGDIVTLNASTTGPGDSVFTNWTGACTGSGPCSVVMDGDKTVNAVFARIPPVITYPKENQIIASSTSMKITWTSNTLLKQGELQDVTASTTIFINSIRGSSTTIDVVPGHSYLFSLQAGGLVTTKRSEKTTVAFTISTSTEVENLSMADQDNDGVNDLNDKCPDTPITSAGNINQHGCLKPIKTAATKIKMINDENTTDITNVSNLVIEDKNSTFGRVAFIEPINLFGGTDKKTPIDLDSYITIQDKKIVVNSSVAPQLNKPAIITLYNIDLNNPMIKKNGEIYATSTSTNFTYDKINKILTFTVNSFSTYEVIEESPIYTLTASKSGNGKGSIFGIDKGVTLLLAGTNITLTAVADSGSVFSNWTSDCSGAGSCSLTLTSDKTIGAKFTLIEVFSSNSGGGSGGGGAVSNPSAITSTQTNNIQTNKNLSVNKIPASPQIASSTQKTFVFNKNIKLYTKNKDIIELQRFLNNKGYIVAIKGQGSKGLESNYFGPATKKALIKFQIKNNIRPATGLLNSNTRIKINSGKSI